MTKFVLATCIALTMSLPYGDAIAGEPADKTYFACRLMHDLELKGAKDNKGDPVPVAQNGRCTLTEDAPGAKSGDVVDFNVCTRFNDGKLSAQFQVEKFDNCPGTAKGPSLGPGAVFSAGDTIHLNY